MQPLLQCIPICLTNGEKNLRNVNISFGGRWQRKNALQIRPPIALPDIHRHCGQIKALSFWLHFPHLAIQDEMRVCVLFHHLRCYPNRRNRLVIKSIKQSRPGLTFVLRELSESRGTGVPWARGFVENRPRGLASYETKPYLGRDGTFMRSAFEGNRNLSDLRLPVP